MSSNIQFLPNVFKSTMYLVVDDPNPPSHRICGDMKQSPVVEPLNWSAKLFRLSWFDLGLALLNTRWKANKRIASVSSPSLPYIRLQNSRFPTTNYQIHESQMTGTGVRGLLHYQDLGRVDSRPASSVGGYQGRSQYKGSESCKPPA